MVPERQCESLEKERLELMAVTVPEGIVLNRGTQVERDHQNGIAMLRLSEPEQPTIE